MEALSNSTFALRISTSENNSEKSDISQIFDQLESSFANMKQWSSKFEKGYGENFINNWTRGDVEKIETSSQLTDENITQEACLVAHNILFGDTPWEKKFHAARQQFMDVLYQLCQVYFQDLGYSEVMQKNLEVRKNLLKEMEDKIPKEMHATYLEPMKESFKLNARPFSETHITSMETVLNSEISIQTDPGVQATVEFSKNVKKLLSDIEGMVEKHEEKEKIEEFKKFLKEFTEAYVRVDTVESKRWNIEWKKIQLTLQILALSNEMKNLYLNADKIGI